MGPLVTRYALLAVAVVVLNFALPRLLPGDPLDVESTAGMNPAVSTLTAEARARLRASYYLDEPLPGQFAAYVRDLGRGDLGWSISKAAPVSQLIGERLPWTLGLVLTSVAMSAAGGTLLGLLAAWRGRRTDRMVVGLATSLAAIPEFLVAMGLLLALAVGLGWFPLQGGRSAFAPASTGPLRWLGPLADVAWHHTLPALTLILAASAAFVLITRGAMRAVLAEPYLTTARAKGLPETRVALRHAVPNALLPVLTLFGVRVGHVLSGSLGGVIVVERVYSVPGVGLLAFEAIRARDYPVLQAVFLLGSAGMLLANLAVELVYRWLEPRRGA